VPPYGSDDGSDAQLDADHPDEVNPGDLDAKTHTVLRAFRVIDEAAPVAELAEQAGLEKRAVRYRIEQYLEPARFAQVIGTEQQLGAANAANLWALTRGGREWTDRHFTDLLEGEVRANPAELLEDVLREAQEAEDIAKQARSQAGAATGEATDALAAVQELREEVAELREEIVRARTRRRRDLGGELHEREFDSLAERISGAEGLAEEMKREVDSNIADLQTRMNGLADEADEQLERRVEQMRSEMTQLRTRITDAESSIDYLKKAVSDAKKFAPPQRRQVEWPSLKQRLDEIHGVLDEVVENYDPGEKA